MRGKRESLSSNVPVSDPAQAAQGTPGEAVEGPYGYPPCGDKPELGRDDSGSEGDMRLGRVSGLCFNPC